MAGSGGTIATARVRILPDFSGFNQDFGEKLKKNFGNFASRQLAATGQDLSFALTRPILGVFTDGLKVASSFYTTIGELSAVAGESIQKYANANVLAMKDGIRQNSTFIKSLREIARESKFSVQETGDAATALARMGVKNQQEIIDFLTVTNMVAAANREDLTATTEAVATFANVFNLPKNIRNISHIGDVISTVLTSSNQDLQTFTEAMKRAAPVSNVLGYSIDDTASAVSILANLGFKGTVASTSLKNGMVRLQSSLPKVVNTLSKYGIAVKDNEGKSRRFTDILLDISKSGMTMSEQFDIFGQIAGPAMASLTSGGNIKNIQYMAKQMDQLRNKTGQLYNAMKETPEFKIEAVKSNFEELKLTLIDNLMPAVSSALTKTNGLITGMIRGFSTLPGPMKNAIQAALLFAASWGPVFIVLGKIGQASGIVGSALRNLFIGPVQFIGALAQKSAMGIYIASDAIGNMATRLGQAGLGASISSTGTKMAMFIENSKMLPPVLAAVVVAVGAAVYVWKKHNDELAKVTKAQEEFTKSALENLGKPGDSAKTSVGVITDILMDETSQLGKIVNSPHYKKAMRGMGMSVQDLAQDLDAGGIRAEIALRRLGANANMFNDSAWIRGLKAFNLVSDDTKASLDRFNNMFTDMNRTLITKGGAGKDAVLKIQKDLREAAKADPTLDNMVVRRYSYFNMRPKDAADKLKAFKAEAKKRQWQIISIDKETQEVLYRSNTINQQWLFQATQEKLRAQGYIFTETMGFIQNLANATGTQIQQQTAASLQANIEQLAEYKDQLDALRKGQGELGIGPSMASMVSEYGLGSVKLSQMLNAAMLTGQDIASRLGVMSKATGIDIDTIIGYAQYKMDLLKGAMERVKSAFPTMGDAMAKFGAEDVPTLNTALDSMIAKYDEFSRSQQTLTSLIQFGGGQFTTLYEHLSTLDPSQINQIFSGIDFNSPASIAKLTELQNKLSEAMGRAGAAGRARILAETTANGGLGVLFTNPIDKAMQDIRDKVNGTELRPTINPRIDPGAVGRWNSFVSAVRSLNPVPASVAATGAPRAPNIPSRKGHTIPIGRAGGGPVWSGLRSRVNENGREGFIGMDGQFSMLPNRSSMRFGSPGYVVPSNRLRGSGGTTIYNSIYVPGVHMEEVVRYQTALEQAQLNRLGT